MEGEIKSRGTATSIGVAPFRKFRFAPFPMVWAVLELYFCINDYIILLPLVIIQVCCGKCTERKKKSLQSLKASEQQRSPLHYTFNKVCINENLFLYSYKHINTIPYFHNSSTKYTFVINIINVFCRPTAVKLLTAVIINYDNSKQRIKYLVSHLSWNVLVIDS